MKFLICVAVLAGAVAFARVEPSSDDIAVWVGQLGDSDFQKREEATRRLTAAGEAALPALREAIVADGAPEVAQRAREVTWVIVRLTPERQAQVAAKAAAAFAAGDYETAAREQMLIARTRRPTVEECIRVGHDWQMANRWAEAVAGYDRALERVRQVLGGDPEREPPPLPAPEGKGPGFGGGGGRGPGLAGAERMALTEHQVREFAGIRAGLVLMIGRIRREKLNDPRGAAAALGEIVEMTPEFQGTLPALLAPLAGDVKRRRVKREVAHDVGRGLSLLNEFDVMEELAKTQESLGRDEAAILTLVRLCGAYLHTREDGVEDALARLTRLIERTPAVMAMEGGKALVELTPAPAVVAAGAGAKPQTYANAASPFRWTATNLGTFGLGGVAVRDLARLPDGRWVGAMTADGKVYTAATRDGVMWDAPQLLPYCGIANNTDPAVIADGNGAIWVAWFANRMSLHPRSSGGYTLWITHSADGKTWSSPRAIGADTGGWPMGAMHWLRTREGRFRLSWRAAAATTANSPGEITKLEAVDLFQGGRAWPMDPQIVQDDGGRYHLVMDDRLGGLRYANSRDGVKWSDSIVLVEKQENKPSTEGPNLLIDGQRSALIYSVGGATWLRRGSLSAMKELGAAVQIADGAATAVGTRWVRMGNEVVGFATGGDAVWMMHAGAADVFKGR